MTDLTKEVSCSHCGSLMLVPEQSFKHQTHFFCCSGCETVYALLHQLSLDHYYTLKSAVGAGGAQPVDSRETDYSFLDDPQTLATYMTHPNQLYFYVEGMHCAACIWLFEKIPDICPEVSRVQVSFDTSVIVVTRQEGASFSVIASFISALGYGLYPVLPQEDLTQFYARDNKSALLRIGISGACMGNMMLMAISLYAGLTGTLATVFLWLSWVLSFPVVTYCAWPFYKGAVVSLKLKAISIDVLVSFSLILGWVLSTVLVFFGRTSIYFDSIGMFCFLLLSTRYMLKKAQQNAVTQAVFLDHYLPYWMTVQDGALWVKRPLKHVQSGAVVRFETGDMVALDGVQLSETGVVDTHLMTGEPLPKTLKKGSAVQSGMINVGPPLCMTVTHAFKDSRLNQLLATLKSLKKPQLMSHLDRITTGFLWGLLLVIVCYGLFMVWRGSWLHACEQVLALSMIACPCAFALAAPLGFTLTLKRLAQHGIYIKDAEVFERLSRIRHLCFDKTGTLTQGQMDVDSLHFHQEDVSPEVLSWVRQLEEGCVHPIAKAICRYLDAQGILPSSSVTEITEKIGEGVWGKIGENVICVKQGEADRDSAKTQVGVYLQETLCVSFVLTDVLWPTTVSTFERLRQSYRCTLLSGDQRGVVQDLSARLFCEGQYELSPEDKLRFIQAHQPVLFCGDGANDVAALKAAYVGVAVQGSLDVSLQACDCYLLSEGVSGLPLLLRESRRVLKTVSLMIGFSIAYNLLGVGLVLMYDVTPFVAALLMPLSSLTVIGMAKWRTRS